MPFLVEDGTGLEDSNSYVDLAFVDDYFNLRGVEEWAGVAEAKEIHLIKGSDYADQRWGNRLLGSPLLTTQAMAVPRACAYTKNGTPLIGVVAKWKKAVCEYALLSLLGKLQPETENSTKEVLKKKTVVGPITTEIEYDAGSVASTILDFPVADKLARVMVGSSQARTSH
jgi:hypothetical protein